LGVLPFERAVRINLDYLSISGWKETSNSSTSFYHGEFRPWITFAAAYFLDSLTLENFRILEFGSGASTIYFSKRAKSVVSIEHDDQWISMTRKHLEQFNNVALLPLLSFSEEQRPELGKSVDDLSPLLAWDVINEHIVLENSAALLRGLERYLTAELDDFDLVFVDGGVRNLVLGIISRSNYDGLIVVDNSDAGSIAPGLAFLRERWSEIPFRGLGPINPYESQTSVFILKSQNSISHKISSFSPKRD
jgi:hypothetical protein